MRREVLKTALGIGLGVPLIQRTAAAAEPAAMPPQEGDRLVYLVGDRKGEVIKVDDLTLGGPQVLAVPMDSKSNTVRDGNRLNQLIVIRLNPDELKPDAKTYAANGVVAFSSVCTHQGCDVSQWKADSKMLLCVCHGSEYDPHDRATVTAGPAPKRLPSLPLKMDGDALAVAGPFRGKPGPAAL